MTLITLTPSLLKMYLTFNKLRALIIAPYIYRLEELI